MNETVTQFPPATSPNYREQLARMLRAHAVPNKARMVDALVNDRSFAPTDPDRTTTARSLVEIVFKALVACVIVAVLSLIFTQSAHAASISRGHEQWPCIEVERAAGIVQAEAFSQPREAQAAILQIVSSEARSRGMSVCELSARTWFVSVYQYGRLHPYSWTARQFVELQPWALVLAEDVLAGRVPDARRGAMHFDGALHANDLFVIGGIHFQP